jgi:hypothetical protein
MRGERLGEAALSGWRQKVAKGVATPVARRSSADQASIEQVIGILFFVLAVVYTVRTIATWARRAGEGRG